MIRDLFRGGEPPIYSNYLQRERDRLIRAPGTTREEPRLVVDGIVVLKHDIPNHVIIYHHNQELGPAYVSRTTYDPYKNTDLRTALVPVKNGNETITWTLFEFRMSEVETSILADPQVPATE